MKVLIVALTLLNMTHFALAIAETGLVGEWAVAPSGQKTTAIMKFLDDGTVVNTTAEGYGTYQFLDDGRLMIEFPDAIILGHPKMIDGKIMLNGTISTSQPLSLSLSEVTEDKVKTAKTSQAEVKSAMDEYLEAMAEIRKTSQEKMIINNLRQYASAAQQYMLETGSDFAEYDDLVGEDKYIRLLESVNGESYKELKVGNKDTKISVKDGDGHVHSYRF
jgi:hypothetical protein